MTFLHHCVPSSFDKNASSLQHTDGFSIGSAEHRSHKRSKDVFDGDRDFLTLKLNPLPPSLVVLLYKSTLGSGDTAKSAICLPNYLEFKEQRLERATTIRHQCPQSTARYSRWRPREFRRG